MMMCVCVCAGGGKKGHKVNVWVGNPKPERGRCSPCVCSSYVLSVVGASGSRARNRGGWGGGGALEGVLDGRWCSGLQVSSVCLDRGLVHTLTCLVSTGQFPRRKTRRKPP
jgi:hypothetical protein